MSEDHVERCDRAAQGGVCLVLEAILHHELRRLPQVGKRQEQKAARLQHADELCKSLRHFVALKVLEIVRRPYLRPRSPCLPLPPSQKAPARLGINTVPCCVPL